MKSGDFKVTIDKKPHEPWGKHVDLVHRFESVPGVFKLRIGDEGRILSREIGVRGEGQPGQMMGVDYYGVPIMPNGRIKGT